MLDILMNFHVMVNWQLSQRVSADQCHMTVSWAQVYNLLRWRVFKVIRLLVIGLNWSQAQVHDNKAIK